jgi:hypothetical protein
MNTETKSIYHRITENVLFSNVERPQTKSAVEAVLLKIGNHDKTDLNLLESLEFCAPDNQSRFTVIPRGEYPIVLLSPSIEEMEGVEAEHCTARAFAEGIAMAKGTSKNKLTGEIDRMLRSWDYPVESRGAVGASA